MTFDNHWGLYRASSNRVPKSVGAPVAVGQAFQPDIPIVRLESLTYEAAGSGPRPDHGNVSETLGIPRKKLGKTTWKRLEIARSIQADQCYYFSAAELAADKAARARKSNDVADYPNPDLAIEIDLIDPH